MIPDYILVILKLCGFDNENSLKRAYERSPQDLFNLLQATGKTILKSTFYSESIKDFFRDECHSSFVDPDNFCLLFGHWYQLEGVLEEIQSNKFQKHVKAAKKKGSDPKVPIGSSFSEENKTRLLQLLSKSWPAKETGVETPENFRMFDVSPDTWSVECPICSKNQKVYLKFGKNVVINRGNFQRHMKIHFLKPTEAQIQDENEEYSLYQEDPPSKIARIIENPEPQNVLNQPGTSSVAYGQIVGADSFVLGSQLPQTHSTCALQNTAVIPTMKTPDENSSVFKTQLRQTQFNGSILMTPQKPELKIINPQQKPINNPATTPQYLVQIKNPLKNISPTISQIQQIQPVQTGNKFIIIRKNATNIIQSQCEKSNNSK
jgi:hypothetical protein